MQINPSESKRRNSLLNALTSIVYTGINGLLTLIVTRVILLYYGSDYNGLNTTANQIVSILLVLESGFTLASNVALFSPMAEKNNKLVSKIISTTKASFIKIGVVYLLVGTLVVLVYSRLIESSIPYLEILLILLVSLIPTALNLIFATKYSVLFQSSQHEYIINTIKIVACIIGQFTVICIAAYGINRILLRVLMLLNSIIAVALIILIGKKKYSYLDMNLKPDYKLIPGTKDIMVQKFVGLAYSTAPTLIMSARIGTIAISIFGVYNSVVILMRSVANAFLNSPRMSLGVLIAENNLDRTKTIFREYENIVFITTSIMTICYYSLIMPFVSIYTKGVNDANYVQNSIAVLMGLIFYIECLHIPSGIFLNMAGIFKVSKNIQSIAAIVLGSSLIISFFVGSINAFVISILVSAISLAIMEIGYVHFKSVMMGESMDNRGLIDMLFYSILTVLFSFIGYRFSFDYSSYFELFIGAVIVFFVSCVGIIVFLFFYNKELLYKYTALMKRLIKRQD